MKLYVIAGKAGSGKNTCANYIKEYYENKGKKVVLTEISKYLKVFAKEIIDWDGSYETKPRSFLQELGSKIRYTLFDEDFLLNRLKEDIKIYNDYADVLVISDARLPREIDFLKSLSNSTTIKVINKFSDYELKGEEKYHETETSLDNYNAFDYIFENDTLDNFKNKIYNMIEEVDSNEN